MERITIELPIVSIEPNQPIFSSDFAKEHYEIGMFILDDGVMRHMVHYDGVYVNTFPCPNNVVERYLVEKSIRDNDAIYHRDMEAIEDRLKQIARLVGETKDEVLKSETRLMEVIVEEGEVRDREFNTLREGLEELECSRRGGDMGGVNILDVARAAAVIQKPELIKELSK